MKRLALLLFFALTTPALSDEVVTAKRYAPPPFTHFMYTGKVAIAMYGPAKWYVTVRSPSGEREIEVTQSVYDALKVRSPYKD